MLTIANDGEFVTLSTHSKDCFMEEIVWNGYMHVGKCSHIAHEDSRQFLHPKNDRYYLTEVTLDNKVTYCKRLSHEQALRWLLYNNHRTLPDNLKHIIDEVH